MLVKRKQSHFERVFVCVEMKLSLPRATLAQEHKQVHKDITFKKEVNEVAVFLITVGKYSQFP